jgi:hypothetical protein
MDAICPGAANPYCSCLSKRIYPPRRARPRAVEPVRRRSHSFPEWAPDGSCVYYRRLGTGDAGFWAAPLEGGPPRLLVVDDDPSMRTSHTMFATDGERFYFPVTTFESDIWFAALE